ncbi:MAG TPA: hypothetical protein VKR58_02265, partial [Aquella sp.]|nr:hypothetical protein [Aquella sp.]
MIESALKNPHTNVNDVSNLTFRTNGHDLIITYHITRLTDVIVPLGQIGVYAKIASNLDIIQIDNLCNTNTEFRRVCKDSVFWIELFKQKYPGKYVETKENLDWEKLYRL